MISMKSSEAPSLMTATPFERELKVLLSPILQEKVQGFSVGMTLLPPGNATSDHVHDKEVEAWLIIYMQLKWRSHYERFNRAYRSGTG